MNGKDEAILWVDLTLSTSGVLPPGVMEQFAVNQVQDARQIDRAIRAIEPRAACFEYDVPDDDGLNALAETRRAHPALPILVVSTRYSDELAVCAARAHAWNYIVKPYAGPMADTLRAVILISRRASERRAQRCYKRSVAR